MHPTHKEHSSCGKIRASSSSAPAIKSRGSLVSQKSDSEQPCSHPWLLDGGGGGVCWTILSALVRDLPFLFPTLPSHQRGESHFTALLPSGHPREATKHQQLQEMQPKSKVTSSVFTWELKFKAAGDGQAHKVATFLKSPNILSTKKWKGWGGKPLPRHIHGEASWHINVFGYVTNYLKSYGGFCFGKAFH